MNLNGEVLLLQREMPDSFCEVTDRLESADLPLIAEAVLEMPAEWLAQATLWPRAESALAAPFDNIHGVDLYDDPAERAAICCAEMIRCRPLPLGNKRLGYECMREMLERSRIPWPRPSEDVDEIASTIEGLAARTISEREFVSWVKRRTQIRG